MLQPLFGYFCFHSEKEQSKANEGTGKPFVLIEGNFVVIENGVAHHHVDSWEIVITLDT